MAWPTQQIDRSRSAAACLQGAHAELTEAADKWRKVPREIAAESAAKTCVLPPDPPDGSCRLESFGAINEALRYQIQAYRDGDLRTQAASRSSAQHRDTLCRSS